MLDQETQELIKETVHLALKEYREEEARLEE